MTYDKLEGFFLAQIGNREIRKKFCEQLIESAKASGEIKSEAELDGWFENRFKPQTVWLNEDDYARAITRALPQALGFAGTDFGSSRQRDIGQLWTDTARGFLGEIAFQRFLSSEHQIEMGSDITMDKKIEDYIQSDIEYILEPDGIKRKPRQRVSIKSGKFNARWLDEYGSGKWDAVDSFVFVKIGVQREHFIAFLKKMGFLKDKLLPKAVELGELKSEMGDLLLNDIPDFEPLPAYIAGFLIKNECKWPIHSIDIALKGRKNRRMVIERAVGLLTRENLRVLPSIQSLDPTGNLPIEIAGIGSEVGDSPHFYANVGALHYGKVDWHHFVYSL